MTLDAGSVSLQPRGILGPWLFCTINLNRENGDGVVSGWTTCDTSTYFCMTFRVFYALQETDNWTISAMYVPGHIVYGRDLGKTAILCPRQVCQFHRSWVSHARCTALLVGAMMILSVYLPHSGYDEEDHIATPRGSEGHHGRGEDAGSG